jgi:hypothetical protein
LIAVVCRDIAHRSDIPKWLKDDIKHNLQNKLHRFVIFGCHSYGVQSHFHHGGRLGLHTIFSHHSDASGSVVALFLTSLPCHF